MITNNVHKWFGLILCMSAFASAKEPVRNMVDSGSFGVFANGQRVATETFSVEQESGGASNVRSEVKSGAAVQNSQLQMLSDGSLLRYEWHEVNPGKTALLVVPNNDFLKESVTQNPNEKPAEQPFLMPKTTAILDNNFLVHRQLLAWRYLASSCMAEKDQAKCPAATFGVLVPQERISARVTMQTIGQELVTLKGTEKPLVKLSLKLEDEEWNLWVDPADHFKLLRATRTGVPMEIVRD